MKGGKKLVHSAATSNISLHLNDPQLIVGQGTLGAWEGTKIFRKIQIAVVPIGGGGLISGPAMALKLEPEDQNHSVWEIVRRAGDEAGKHRSRTRGDAGQDWTASLTGCE